MVILGISGCVITGEVMKKNIIESGLNENPYRQNHDFTKK